ncbi:alpha-amylase [Paenibacillus swuensis]|uniref:Alpha-amylase n=1 Tax=Paenibacillus swuensis TaxID=1178515 RepID=A0A172TPU2_9BACL|nr:alpha-amylase family glycosyl hydrolase [Paenibacillus swuensis]ANE49099.1 alpha-amylase [Paenibacillus swuensis]
MMIVQICLTLLLPTSVEAGSPLAATSVTEDQRISFQLPEVTVKAQGSFGSSQEYVMTDGDGDGVLSAEITGLSPNEQYTYRFLFNGTAMSDDTLTARSDENGKVVLHSSPQYVVKGSFDNWSTEHELTRTSVTESTYNYTTTPLPAADYEYKYVAREEGKYEVYFFDPTNPATANNNSVITVPSAGGEVAPTADVFADQPGGKTKWVIAGSWQGWNNASAQTQMSHLTGDYYAYSEVLPAGKHEFKIVRSGTWEGYSNNGDNYEFTLTKPGKVNLYVNEATNQVRTNVEGVAGIPKFLSSISEDKHPRIVGSVQKVFGEAEWSPAQANQYFVDYHFDGTLYKLQRTLPAGSYEAKVVFGPDWSGYENYGARDGANLKVNVLDPSNVTFTLDYSKPQAERQLVHDYIPMESGADGQIDKAGITFNSRSVTFKKPFGAVAEETSDVTLRIAAKREDVQIAKVELIDGKGMASTYEMKKAATVGEQDYFEVIIPKTVFQGIGIWGYKFILVDGASKLEYGDDGLSGGTGVASEEGAIPFNLTVYKKDFKTPDWMKNAVVYQIFPDRFFDGSQGNNRAKTVDGYRGTLKPEGANLTEKGGHPLQYMDGGVPNEPAPSQVWGTWSDFPELPDRSLPENKPYYPDAQTDGVWTNEFYGGDIQGVQQKIKYLQSIGVTVIYFNPLAWAASNHKYDATDYKHLDPMFGEPIYNVSGDPTSGLNYEETRKASDQVFTDFAKAARAAGIRIIVDGVFNHVGDDSIYFDRYEKYPEIGAYEYWSKVWDEVNAGATQAQAEQEVRNAFTSKTNTATGKPYQYPEDFNFTKWFTVENVKVDDRDKTGKIYKYEAWWGYDSLPAIDAKAPQEGDADALEGLHEYNNPDYREQVIGLNLDGMTAEEADRSMQNATSQRWNWLGARGWRLDVAPDVSQGTWQKFRESVKSTAGKLDANGQAIDDPIILGEEWGVATHYLLGDQFDSVMNYQFRGAMQNFIINGNAAEFHEALERIRENYPDEAWKAMLNLVDSHDTTRSITKYEHPDWEEEKLSIPGEASDRALEDQALTAIFQMSYPGAPTVYYGDEVGLTGTKDPDSRRTFPWERVESSADQYAGAGRYAELFRAYQSAASVRNENEVFRTGDLQVAYAEGDVIAYARKNESKAGLTVINRSSSEVTFDANVAGFLPDGLTLIDQLYGSVQGVVTAGKINITVPARSGLMMISEQALSMVEPVAGLQANGDNSKVHLTWNPVVGSERYNIYRAPMEGGAVEKIATLTETSYTDNAVVNGNKYYYAVTAQIGTGEGLWTDMVSATPSFAIQHVEISTPAEEMTIGLGKKTSEIAVTVDVPGLTDDSALAGKEASRLLATIRYYLEGTEPSLAFETKLRYKADTNDGKKIYTASFEPTVAGVYRYFAKVSTDNGDTFRNSDEQSVTTLADLTDVTAPPEPVLNAIEVESNRVQLQWVAGVGEASGFEIYRKAASGVSAYSKVATVASGVASYVDFSVSNDTSYIYKIAAFDQSYNRAESGEQSVTPKLVLVDVNIRLHIPEYTPTTSNIYLAGTVNGWNASGWKLTVPSGATDRRVVEYSFKMMAGKTMEYKFTRGSWNTEAFSSHTRVPNDTQDYGNWAYSSTDTNMKLTIANQGGNKMIVNDYVLRWVDMPLMVTLPRTSYNENIEYTTDEEHFTLKAKVPYGVNFTLNGQPIPAEAMDAYGNVLIERIPLSVGLNKFVAHIEPSAETLNLPWYTDKGRAGQATKTMELMITRTGEDTGGTEVAVTGVVLNVEELKLSVNDAPYSLIANILPNNATNKELSWISSNPDVATVSEIGVVTPIRPGHAEITVITNDGLKTAKVKVNVNSAGGQGNGQGEGQGNGQGNGQGEGQGNGQGNGQGEGQSNGQGNGHGEGQGNSQGNGQGNGNGNGQGSGNNGGHSNNVEEWTDSKSSKLNLNQILKAVGESSHAENVTIKVGDDIHNVLLPTNALDLFKDKGLQINNSNVQVEVPSEVLKQLMLTAANHTAGMQVLLQMQPLDVQAREDRLHAAEAQVKATWKAGSEVYQFRLSVVGADGKEISSLNTFTKPMVIQFKVKENVNRKRIGIYHLAEDGKLEWIGGQLNSEGMISAEIRHFSEYAVLEMNRTFGDVASKHWAFHSIQDLAARHMVFGTTTDVYEPNRIVTRAELAALLVRALNLKESAEASGYNDVSANEWYAKAVAGASKAGLIYGKSVTVFAPNDPVTREEMAAMLVRASAMKQEHTKVSSAELNFTDSSEIGAWSKDAVQQAVGLGFLKGVGNNRFAPQAFATRAECALILSKLLEY